MNENNNSAKKSTVRSSFSGKLGYVLAVAGSAVGLGNIWRFPYLVAKYGGGIFLLVYLVLMLTFGFALIMAESALGRMTGESPIGAYESFGQSLFLKFGGRINAIIPMIIVPYYSVIGGWVFKYLAEYIRGNVAGVAGDDYFSNFISETYAPSVFFIIFVIATLFIVMAGVEKGVERASKIMMPVLIILAVIVAIYSITRPGAMEGVKYFLIPDFSKFSLMTIVAAMGQMFYSLSIAMGILVTYGSYMKKDVDMEKSTSQIEIFDTGIAILSGLMIIPAVFAFSGGSTESLKAGPSLMFITIPKIFNTMGFGRIFGIVFFLLVLFAALTSSISLMETNVSTISDATGLSRKKSTLIIFIEILVFGIPCCLGFSILDFIKPLGMDSILDFFDFISNSVMMPVAALCTCFLIVKIIGFDKITAEIKRSSKFKREKIFRFCIRYLAPLFLMIILVSSIANAFGLISM
ncbi:MAG: sodium-dependent transporter [Clostridiales bacterium]|nr:sodium-dependent transporter [Clostridiales bacterium]MDY3747420.1 sodium-dependent transporter [Lachnospiraceae bacterium]